MYHFSAFHFILFSLNFVIVFAQFDPGPLQPCPVADEFNRWLHVSSGTPGDTGSCIAVSTRSQWEDTPAPSFCSTPFWRHGPGAGLAVLWNSSQAKAVSSLLPPSGTAWVALALAPGPDGLAWAWPNSSSRYGLADSSAWVGGAIPSNSTADRCAVLTSTGLLTAAPCQGQGVNVTSSVACAIPACGCRQGQECTTSTALPRRLGFTCTPESQVAHITGWQLFPARAPGAWPTHVLGCATMFNSSGQARTALRAIAAYPGDVIRLCGTFSGRQPVFPAQLQGLHFHTRDAGFAVPPLVCTFNGTRQPNCTEFQIMTVVSSAVSLPQTIAVGSQHQCIILASPLGAVRCWGSSSASAATLAVPADLEPALTIAASVSTTCVLTAGMRRVVCWGSDASGLATTPSSTRFSIERASALLSLAVGGDMACVTTDSVRGFLYGIVCWGAGSLGSKDVVASDGTMAISSAYMHSCGLRWMDSSIACQGNLEDPTLVPPGLPASDHTFAGGTYSCAVAAGTGEVNCWGTTLDSGITSAVAPRPVQGLGPVTYLRGNTHSATGGSILQADQMACAVFQTVLTFRCWFPNGTFIAGLPSDLPVRSLDVSTGSGYRLCVVRMSDGEVLCWERVWGGRAVPLEVNRTALVPSSHRIPVFAGSGTVQAMPLGLDIGSTDLVPVLAEWAPQPPQVTNTPPGSPTFPHAIAVRRVPASSLPNPGPFVSPAYRTWDRYDVPAMTTLVQVGDAMPAAVVCPTTLVRYGYDIFCQQPLFSYGLSMTTWNGSAMVQWHTRRPGPLTLTRATVRRSSSGLTTGAALEPVNITAAALALAQALTPSLGIEPTTAPAVLSVRPGDRVQLTGSGFGLHAAHASVPWWQAAHPSHLRSCIHLAWWAQSASYHDDSACFCDGVEGWLGEGELPLAAVQAWNDSSITFTVPYGEGVREVRLCVEGRGLNATTNAPRGVRPSSIYLLWQPPTVDTLLPAPFSDSTDADSPLTLGLSTTARPTLELVQNWGRCNVSDFTAALPSGRRPYIAPWPVSLALSSYHPYQHCTATVVVQDSLGACYTMRGAGDVQQLLLPSTQALWRSTGYSSCEAGLTVDPSLTEPALAALADGASGMQGFRVPLPRPAPNAVLSVTFVLHVWDGGLQVTANAALSTITFSRTPPILRSVRPNPLLLGPVGGLEQSQPALLTLYGAGFRTREEVLDPRNGLYPRSPDTFVWIDGIPCPNASVTRAGGLMAYATCVYPAHTLAGGLHTIVMQNIGINTTLSSSDGTTAALTSSCEEGYYGLFAPGHQLCLPCPQGASCSPGVGRVPRAERGFYNMGLPPVERAKDVNVTMLEQSVRDVRMHAAVYPCPDGQEDRPLACIRPCDPPEACEGDNVCAPGYVSVPPAYRCAACASGYYRGSGACVACPAWGIVTLVILILMALVAAAVLFILSARAIRLCTLNTVLEYVQLISLLQGPRIPWPDAVKSVLYALSMARVNIEVTQPECYGSARIEPEMKLWIVVALPAFLILAFATAHVLLALLKARVRGWASLSFLAGAAHAHRDVWGHGPTLFRTLLKLLSAVYLPVVQACLEVFNCAGTEPPDPDGKEFLSIAFEPCWVQGGLQSRMIPWAVAGLVLFGIAYPLTIAAFFTLYSDLIVEDQLLLAASSGFDQASNPRAYYIRQHFAPLYEDYRPGYHFAALLAPARRGLVCVCALMLNKSPQLLSAGVVFIMTIALAIQSNMHPLMSPQSGTAVALARMGGRWRGSHPTALDIALHARVKEIAGRTQDQRLVDLVSGRSMCSDVEHSARPWWAPARDWNILESTLQLHVVMTGLLANMYSAAQGSVYAERAVPAVTSIFFLLLALAAAQIVWTVVYDLGVQAREAAQVKQDDGEEEDVQASAGRSGTWASRVCGSLKGGKQNVPCESEPRFHAPAPVPVEHRCPVHLHEALQGEGDRATVLQDPCIPDREKEAATVPEGRVRPLEVDAGPQEERDSPSVWMSNPLSVQGRES